MRTRMLVLGCLAAALAATGLVGGTAARADEVAKAPPDPTRGQWDSFLDPLRDFEDNYVTAAQKSVEDATKIHLGLGFTEAYTWDFNRPRSGSLIALHSLEHHNDGVPVLGQLAASRPSDGWFIPGFGLKLDAGKVARDVKADWNGNGAVKHGDTFETNDFMVHVRYASWTSKSLVSNVSPCLTAPFPFQSALTSRASLPARSFRPKPGTNHPSLGRAAPSCPMTGTPSLW